MDEETQAFHYAEHKTVVVHRGPCSIEDILRNIDPAPDNQTESFVAAIYADRREAARTSSLE